MVNMFGLSHDPAISALVWHHLAHLARLEDRLACWLVHVPQFCARLAHVADPSGLFASAAAGAAARGELSRGVDSQTGASAPAKAARTESVKRAPKRGKADRGEDDELGDERAPAKGTKPRKSKRVGCGPASAAAAEDTNHADEAAGGESDAAEDGEEAEEEEAEASKKGGAGGGAAAKKRAQRRGEVLLWAARRFFLPLRDDVVLSLLVEVSAGLSLIPMASGGTKAVAPRASSLPPYLSNSHCC